MVQVWQESQDVTQRDVDVEDGGSAIILHITGDEHRYDREGLFVRIQSWADDGYDSPAHDLIKRIIASQHVRVTIEILEDKR